MDKVRTAVVLGAYGLIGAACVRALKSDGFRVIGIGRSLASGRRCDRDIEWIAQDISTASQADWERRLESADVVVNASGALQNGARDNLTGIHETAVSRLISALDGSHTRFVQISAAGVSETATTEFLRSKMRGDQMLMDSQLDWIILRPAVVIGPQAYGGTALLRAAAAFPVIGMKIMPDTPFQSVFVDDVARAVVQAARGEIDTRTVADLCEADRRNFADVTGMIRTWQGFPPWRVTVPVAKPMLRLTGLCADALGWLGWRSPLRTTALKVLEDGVTGDPAAWNAAGGLSCRSLDATLAAMPATTQERWFARLYLLLPLAIATLSLFWTASGLIGFASRQDAQALLTDRGLSVDFASASVIAGAVADIVLGVAILFRPWARLACFGMVAVSLAYLAGGTVWARDLWMDPLGPLVKVMPGIILCLVTAAILEDR